MSDKYLYKNSKVETSSVSSYADFEQIFYVVTVTKILFYFCHIKNVNICYELYIFFSVVEILFYYNYTLYIMNIRIRMRGLMFVINWYITSIQYIIIIITEIKKYKKDFKN